MRWSYVTLTGYDSGTLDKEVNEYLDQGWMLREGLRVVYFPSDHTYDVREGEVMNHHNFLFAQTMVRID